jgi:leader peptidase (prepilin peptidase) / N-methyltransferase
MAFGDVRLAMAVGMGLGWISISALVLGFMLANVLAAVVGLLVLSIQRGDRKSAIPYGVFLAAASALMLLI